jgi:hypothetical protein
MKSKLIAATAALLFAGAGIAGAQTVVITQEQQPVIQKYIVQQQVAPVEMPSGFELAVGATIPETVELHTLDVPDLQLQTQYDYVVVNGQTVLVDPNTRHVVQIIQ